MSRVLAVDPGTSLGWATDSTGRLEWGVEGMGVRRGESEGMRWIKFNKWLDTVASSVGLIVYEQPVVYGKHGLSTISVTLGMATRILEFSELRGIACQSVPPSSLKTFALGKAPKRKKGDPKFDRSKAAMIEAAMLRVPGATIEAGGIGLPELSEHEADALWLFWLAKENLK